ncbi:Glycosyltransferase involved in cell wall bisynthesis [Selenomonas ruminantium]|uniref:Glycosyltransferase involved in cell wall bisynthesis n=1 Tax=Selenomonas ruminantium TaxID=971 RepID=A0A1I3CNL6_SELRU|nr:Glycosyltransferase involved in cell wall bisynthesis [Selenomonas ruminantium]
MSVVITIPIYRETLSITEKVSLQQLKRILGHYPCVFVAPESLEFDYEGLEDGVVVERFPDHYFTSITSYSQLLLTEKYYARFAAYDYLLIYQLDAFVFSDRLQEFCDLGYDYIGAPIAPSNPIWHAIGARVGNGGLSLRKITAARQALKRWEQLPVGRQQIFQDVFLQVEDLFWGWCGVQSDFDFRCAPIATALQFAVQEEVQRCYRRIEAGTLQPFGCHGWNESHVAFWQRKIAACGYDLTGHACVDGKSRRRTDLEAYWQKRQYMDMARLWGALRHGKHTEMMLLLMTWLDRYPAGDKAWIGYGEELQYFWRSCRQQRLTEPTMVLAWERLEQVLDEAILRSLQVGEGEKNLLWLLESLQPLIAQSKTVAAEQLCQQIEEIRWQEWEAKAQYAEPAPAAIKKYHIAAIGIVKNEMDIIESFVRHTLSFADELLLIDHQSTDKTAEILRALQQEGLPLTVHTSNRVEYAQGDMTTDLLYEAINKHGADLVIPLDADEFLVGTKPGKSIREYLEDLDREFVYKLPWRRYSPYQPDVRREEFLLARPALGDIYRDAGNKCIVGAKAVLDNKLQVIQGNHYLYSVQEGKMVGRDMLDCQTLEIAHFYWRSSEQFQTKIAVAWPILVSKYSLASIGGGGYRLFHQRLIKGEAINPFEFFKRVNGVDLRPLVQPQKLRYSQQVTPNPQVNLMQASVLLAERLKEEKILARKIWVTTIVPYLGEWEEFCLRLKQVADQEYPYRQVLIPCMNQVNSSDWMKIKESCKRNLPKQLDWQVLADSPAGEVFTQLSATAKGDFIHWQLPGTEMAANFMLRMVSAIAEQNVPISLLISDGPEDYRNELPYITIHPMDNTQVAYCVTFWQRLVEIGKYPAGGLTGALMARRLMDACGWLRQAFLRPEGYMLPFTAWKILLTAGDTQLVGVITECYAWPQTVELPLETLVMHQLEWYELLQQAKNDWPVESWQEAVSHYCQNGERLLSRAIAEGIDTAAPLWQHYQQTLLQIL